jgi:hypothetical protein
MDELVVFLRARFDELEKQSPTAHNPSYLLADVAAKRRVLARHEPFVVISSTRWPKPVGCCHCSEVPYLTDWPCPEVRDLAAPYAGHPDYQGKWAIEGHREEWNQ